MAGDAHIAHKADHSCRAGGVVRVALTERFHYRGCDIVRTDLQTASHSERLALVLFLVRGSGSPDGAVREREGYRIVHKLPVR